jgi:hypothetical protein
LKILKPSVAKDGSSVVNLFETNSPKKQYTIHKLVANAFLKNPNKKRCVDHINGIRSDNRLINLRFATHAENGMNQGLSTRNNTGCKGVHFDQHANKYRASITINNKTKHIGLFGTLEEAKQARKKVANETFGEYTNAIEKI